MELHTGDIITISPRHSVPGGYPVQLVERFGTKWKVIRRYSYDLPFFLIESVIKQPHEATGNFLCLPHKKWINVENDQYFKVKV